MSAIICSPVQSASNSVLVWSAAWQHVKTSVNWVTKLFNHQNLENIFPVSIMLSQSLQLGISKVNFGSNFNNKFWDWLHLKVESQLSSINMNLEAALIRRNDKFETRRNDQIQEEVNKKMDINIDGSRRRQCRRRSSSQPAIR